MFRAVIMTRSPRRTPAAVSASAVSPTAATVPPKVSDPESLRSQVPSLSRSAAAASSRGMVPAYSTFNKRPLRRAPAWS